MNGVLVYARDLQKTPETTYPLEQQPHHSYVLVRSSVNVFLSSNSSHLQHPQPRPVVEHVCHETVVGAECFLVDGKGTLIQRPGFVVFALVTS